MNDENNVLFRLKSSNNDYIINLKLLKNLQPQKLEITLIHKTKEIDKVFFLERNREELISENENLSEFNTIEEIFKYIITLIRHQHITIIKPNISYYYIKLFDDNNNIDFQILIQRKGDNYSQREEKEEIKSLKDKIKYFQEQIDILTEKMSNKNVENENIINNSNKDNSDQNNNNNPSEISRRSIYSRFPSSIIDDDDDDKWEILKENNNDISSQNTPNKRGKAFIISDKNEQCENFTAFIDQYDDIIIVWTLREKGELKFFNLKKDVKKEKKNAHSKNINCVQYFHAHKEFKDYIISLSQSDMNIMKFWLIDDEGRELTLKKEFTRLDFNMNIEIFCIFNFNIYDENNSFLFIYGEHMDNRKADRFVYNRVKSNEIVCYKLDQNLNIVKWVNNEEINYNKINNYYEVKNLDTYYNFDPGELYLINSNINDIEVINDLFKTNRGKIFHYKNWNTHFNAFIKKIKKDDTLKLFGICLNGLIIWNLKNNDKPEYVIKMDDFCPYDIISWDDNYLFVSGNDKIKIVNASGQIIDTIQKDKGGYSKIRKIVTPKSEELIVTIDNYQLKCWPFYK